MTERANANAAEHAAQVTAIQTALAHMDKRRTGLIRALEMAGDLDPELLADIHHRRGELATERTRLCERLDELDTAQQQRSNPDLLELPVGAYDLNALPEDVARRLLEALRLQIHYNKTEHPAPFSITLTTDTLITALQASTTAISSVDPMPRYRWP